MIILDTNVLYYLSGIETNKNINLEKLKLFIENKECFCTLYSFFEILNSTFSFQDKMKVIKYIAINKVHIEGNAFIDNDVIKELSNKVKDEEYYKQLKLIYGRYIKNEIAQNIKFFVMSYAYTSATVYLDNYQRGLTKEKEYFRRHFTLLQKDIDNHLGKIINTKLTSLLNDDEFNVDSIQKMLLCLIANLMTYYYALLKYAKEVFEQKDANAYYKIIRKFKMLKKELLKDNLQDDIEYDYRYFNVCQIIMDEFKTSEDLPKLKPGKVKAYFIDKVMSSIYFVDINMRNEFEEEWLKRNIEPLYGESSKIKPNDFLDYEILRELYYYDNIDLLITFDDKMRSILSRVKGSKKFIESENLIKSFEV